MTAVCETKEGFSLFSALETFLVEEMCMYSIGFVL